MNLLSGVVDRPRRALHLRLESLSLVHTMHLTPQHPIATRLVMLALVMVLGLPSGAAEAQVTLRPVTQPGVCKSGRAWMVNPPGSGDGSMQQIDDVSPAIVGDGQGDQGWGYLMAFPLDEKFIRAAASRRAQITLSMNTGRVALGAHSDIKLHLLSRSEAPAQFSAFRAYNMAPDFKTLDETLPPDETDATHKLDLTELIGDPQTLKPGTVLYLLLACDPITDKDGGGEHLEIYSRGDEAPELTAGSAPN